MSPGREQAWLQKADNDLLAADNNLAASRVPFDAVCFHCQQAAEKSLKGREAAESVVQWVRSLISRGLGL